MTRLYTQNDGQPILKKKSIFLNNLFLCESTEIKKINGTKHYFYYQ